MNRFLKEKRQEWIHLGVRCLRFCSNKHLYNHFITRYNSITVGFDHIEQGCNFNLHRPRLAIEVFGTVLNEQGQVEEITIDPIVTNPIYGERSEAHLTITDKSDSVSPANGGKKIIVVGVFNPKDIQIRVYEKNSGPDGWEHKVYPTVIYNKTTFWFDTPPYKDVNIAEPVEVLVELCSKNALKPSSAVTLEYRPVDLTKSMELIRRKAFEKSVGK